MTRRIASYAFAIMAVGISYAEASSAANFDAAEIEKISPYRDLPGVKDPDGVSGRRDGQKCTSEVRMIRRGRGGAGISATEPAVVYSCEENGITYESTRPPVPEQWIPGINPRSLR